MYGSPGYRLEPVGKRKRYAIVPEQAKIVRKIFQMRADGHGFKAIVQHLNTRDIPSPRGGQWRVSGIFSLLRNESYIGTIRNGMTKRRKGKRGCAPVPRSEWTVKENAHEAIIDMKLWRRVRKLDVGNTRHPRHQHRFLWTGFLRCSECGGNLVRHNNRGVPYYGCQSGRNIGEKWPCSKRCFVQVRLIGSAIRACRKPLLLDMALLD